MSRFFGSIRFRLVAIYLAVIVVAFVAVSSIVSDIVENFLVSERVQEQLDSVEKLSLDNLSVYYARQNVAALYSFASEWVQQKGGRVMLLDTDAVVQMDTGSDFNGYLFPCREARAILVEGQNSSFGFHEVQMVSETDMMTVNNAYNWVVYYGVPLRYGDELLGVLLYADSIQDVADSVNSVTQKIGVVFMIFAAAVGIISLMISGWLTRPILTLTNAIRRVGAQGYSERVPAHGKDELAQLADAFNIMSEKLENHDKLRNDFVSNASHELKTPLSTMKVLSETILYQEEPDPAMSREFFQDVDHEIDRLTHIIDDLLRLVKEENAQQSLERKPIEFETLIQRVISRLMPLAKKKGIRLERKLSQVRIEGDEMRLEQVMTNLIDNALKYTDKGYVSVSLKQEGQNAVVAVRDTGIGIPKEAIPRLFERFYRVDKARSRDTGGTGLGLAIVERIVSLHGGFIQVDSIMGRGTTFTVRLPLVGPQKEQGGGGRNAKAKA